MNNEKKQDHKDIAVGIVTYNPDLERLSENIERLYKKSSLIMIFDNCSLNRLELEQLVKEKYSDIQLIQNVKNVGLGIAYNLFFEVAIRENYGWVMLLDQDSVCAKDLIDVYRKFIETDSKVGMYTCIVRDRNSNNSYINKFDGAYQEVSRCISSASVMSVNAYKNGCKYDEMFFIDKLDYDICYYLEENGFVIRQINYEGLLQEIGYSVDHFLFGKVVTVYNHSPNRRYYMARNGMWLAKKHKQRSYIKSFMKETWDIFCVLMFEKEQKWDKFKAYVHGIRDGIIERE